MSAQSITDDAELTVAELRDQFTTSYRHSVVTVACIQCDKETTCQRDEITEMWTYHVCGPITAPWDAHEAAQ